MLGPAAEATTRGRILVADDEPHIRRILATMLERADFEVDPVGSGTEALSRLGGSTPYVMAVMDIMMPGATGLEVLEKMDRLIHRTSLPVLILTAKGQDTDREDALARGASEFMTKPFSPKKLLARIDQILDSTS